VTCDIESKRVIENKRQLKNYILKIISLEN